MNIMPENDLRSLLDARSIALVHGDVDFFKLLLADDFIYTNSSGAVLDKAAYLKFYIESRTIQWQAQELDDLRIRHYSDIAVVTCRIHDRVIFEGNEQNAYFRSTQVFVKKADGWQYIAGHTTTAEAP